MRSSAIAGGAGAPSALLAGDGPLDDVLADPEDQDAGDLASGVDEDELNHEEMDTDQVARQD